jgi:hypothetical protein
LRADYASNFASSLPVCANVAIFSRFLGKTISQKHGSSWFSLATSPVNGRYSPQARGRFFQIFTNRSPGDFDFSPNDQLLNRQNFLMVFDRAFSKNIEI